MPLSHTYACTPGCASFGVWTEESSQDTSTLRGQCVGYPTGCGTGACPSPLFGSFKNDAYDLTVCLRVQTRTYIYLRTESTVMLLMYSCLRFQTVDAMSL